MPFAVIIRYAGNFICQEEDCIIFHDGDTRKVCVQWFCLWKKKWQGDEKLSGCLETLKFITKKVFPGSPRNVSFNVFEGLGQYLFFLE